MLFLAHLSFLGWVGFLTCLAPGIIGLWLILATVLEPAEPVHNLGDLIGNAVWGLWGLTKIAVGVILILITIILLLIAF